MFYIYRPHRGSIDKSLKEVCVVRDLDSIKTHIIEEFSKYGVTLTPDDITFSEETHNDKRIGWEATRYVCVAHMGKERFDVPQCVGMCCDSEHLPKTFADEMEELLENPDAQVMPSFSLRVMEILKPGSLLTESIFNSEEKRYMEVIK